MNADLNDIVLTSVGELMTTLYPKGKLSYVNNRATYALSFCLKGQITYNHEGRRYVSDKSCAIILPKGQSYTLFGDAEGIFPVINFDCTAPFTDTHITIPIDSVEPYVKDYEKLRSLSVFEGNRMKMLSILYNMLHKLLSPASHGVLMPVMKYIENNYSNPALTIGELAQVCGVSEVYFRRLFFRQYKTSPKQFIIDVRINRAKQLLSEGALKISAISESCGFSNPYHFCRSFKAEVGVTPTEYMLENRVLNM